MIPTTKEEAKKLGFPHYIPKEPCNKGHISKRRVKCGTCLECHRLYMLEYSKKPSNKVKKSKLDKNYRKKNASKINARGQKWAEENRERSNQIKQEWKIRHKDRYKIYLREYNAARAKDPHYRLCRNIGKAIYNWLTQSKSHRHWESFVKFTKEQLIDHIQKQFRDGMTWDNYGLVWHLDHIKPIAACQSFDEAWNLTNLQPLLIFENLSKNSRYDGKRYLYESRKDE